MATELKNRNTDEAVGAAPVESAAGNPDATEIADKYDEAYYLNMHNFTVSPEEYDRIVAICLEPPGPPNEKLLRAARRAKELGFI